MTILVKGMEEIRALLVNPWICDFAAYDLWAKPLGLLRIASYLKKAGASVVLLDCLDRFSPRLIRHLKEKFPARKYPRTTVYGSGPYYSEIIDKPSPYHWVPRQYKRYGMPLELFCQILGELEKPDIILVTSGLTYWYPGVFTAIRLLKEEFKTTPLILGGIYASLCQRHAREKSGADLVFAGSSLPKILRQINEFTGAKLREAPEGAVQDAVIFPAYDLYPELRYITLRTSVGCPFRCSYCGWYLLSENKKYHCEEPLRVIEGIEYFYRKFGVKNFSFYDDALLYRSEKHIIPILEGVLARGIRCFFHTPNGLHARYFTPELARYFKKAGFVQPRLALETVDEVRQQKSGGKVSEGELQRALFYLQQAGYAPHEIGVYVLMGLPHQPLSEVEESIRFVHRLGARVFLEEYAPVPGTPDYMESGLLLDIDPLYHNNSIFPLYGCKRYAEFQAIKDLAHRLNQELSGP